MRAWIAILSAMTMTVSVRAADWPQWLGPKRDGGTTETVKPWTEPLKVLWKQPVGEGHGGPVVAGGKAFLFHRNGTKNEETLAAFDAESGKPLWSTPYPRKPTQIPFGNGPRSAPCIDGDMVFTFGITSILTGFDVKSGKIVWQVDCETDYKAPTLRFGSSCSPIVAGEHVLINVGAKGASIVAFDKKTGKEAWKKLDDAASYSSPRLYKHGAEDRVVFLTAKGLTALDPKTGNIHWQYPFVDFLLESSCTPVLVGDKILTSSITAGSALVQETNDAKPAKIWTNSLNCYFATPLVVGADSIYMVTGSLLQKTAVLRCVDAATGKERWSRDNVGKYHATLIRTGDNKILMVEEKGDLVLIEPNVKEYKELARGKICGNTWAHPAVANGRLYIRDAMKFICVELPK